MKFDAFKFMVSIRSVFAFVSTFAGLKNFVAFVGTVAAAGFAPLERMSGALGSCKLNYSLYGPLLVAPVRYFDIVALCVLLAGLR